VNGAHHLSALAIVSWVQLCRSERQVGESPTCVEAVGGVVNRTLLDDVETFAVALRFGVAVVSADEQVLPSVVLSQQKPPADRP
jgi:hypothetical protein